VEGETEGETEDEVMGVVEWGMRQRWWGFIYVLEGAQTMFVSVRSSCG